MMTPHGPAYEIAGLTITRAEAFMYSLPAAMIICIIWLVLQNKTEEAERKDRIEKAFKDRVL